MDFMSWLQHLIMLCPSLFHLSSLRPLPQVFSSLNKCKRQLSFSHRLSSTVNVAQNNNVCQQWHARLGHPSFSVLQFILNKIHILCSSSSISFCDSSKIGKLHQLPFSNCKITTKKPLEFIYSNLWGPSLIVSTERYRYYIIFVNAYTRYAWLYPLK